MDFLRQFTRISINHRIINAEVRSRMGIANQLDLHSDTTRKKTQLTSKEKLAHVHTFIRVLEEGRAEKLRQLC